MEISKHTPGSFCWAELATTDQAAAKRFYSELFGWGFNDVPIGPDSVYTMLQLRGKELGAIYQLGQEQVEHGTPPHWLSYVAVESADLSGQTITAAGGKLLMEPFDVFDAGRMAVAQDPAGASFAIWQPRKHIGAQVKDETNAMCWNELATRDIAAAKSFYGKVFGWNAVTNEAGPTTYTEFYLGAPKKSQGVGGMLQMTQEWGNIPPFWTIYFAVDDCDATVGKAQTLGAVVRVSPTDIPNVGRFAVLVDGQGAGFCVIKLNQIS
ncbi:MAG TPA: VOC family protein [Blastocatellia bacterium]|nr:VOC family protein [Blastocatellia bacterium]